MKDDRKTKRKVKPAAARAAPRRRGADGADGAGVVALDTAPIEVRVVQTHPGVALMAVTRPAHDRAALSLTLPLTHEQAGALARDLLSAIEAELRRATISRLVAPLRA